VTSSRPISPASFRATTMSSPWVSRVGIYFETALPRQRGRDGDQPGAALARHPPADIAPDRERRPRRRRRGGRSDYRSGGPRRRPARPFRSPDQPTPPPTSSLQRHAVNRPSPIDSPERNRQSVSRLGGSPPWTRGRA
jgi:hypothetical protein